ncbi:MAG TPA: hypothetical protein VFQ47_06155 [Nitrososphaera sp.]|jgi:hypothetical protein|nr:hypothetical protein [Nitrososphaera sp.]
MELPLTILVVLLLLTNTLLLYVAMGYRKLLLRANLFITDKLVEIDPVLAAPLLKFKETALRKEGLIE